MEVSFEDYIGKQVLWHFQEAGCYRVTILAVEAGSAIVTGVRDDNRQRWVDGPRGFTVPISEIQWISDPFIQQLVREWRDNGPVIARTAPTDHQRAELDFEEAVRQTYGVTFAVDRF